MAKPKTKIEEPVVEVTEDAPVAVEEVKVVTGTVSKCTKLYIRKKPAKTSNEKDIVCIVNAGEVVTIDETKSNNSWYKVSTKTGKEGFCMKEYITVK